MKLFQQQVSYVFSKRVFLLIDFFKRSGHYRVTHLQIYTQLLFQCLKLLFLAKRLFSGQKEVAKIQRRTLESKSYLSTRHQSQVLFTSVSFYVYLYIF